MKNTKIFILLALSVLLVTSCSNVKDELGFSSKAGVKYNKLSVSESDIDADLKDIANNKPLVEAIKEAGTPLVNDGKVTEDFRASWANIQLQILGIKEVRLAKKMKITDADKKAAEEDAKGLFAQAGTEDADKIWKAFPKSFRDRLISNYAEQTALLRSADKVSDKEIEDYYKKNKDTLSKCDSGKTVSHILVETQKEADKVNAEIKDGKDFAKLAKKYSTDPGSKDLGGDLGCYTEGQFVEAFDAAAKALAPGSVSSIVPTEYGFHILKAEKFEAPTLKDSKDKIADALKPEKQTELFAEVEKKLKKAKTSVLKKYGKIQKDESGIPTVVTLDTKKDDSKTQDSVPTS